MSALVFYPVNPCGGIHVIGSPLLYEMSIEVGNGRRFNIQANGLSEQNNYIPKVSLHGNVHDKPVRG
jgi:putative alpha-1,2-mannosidase